MVAIVVAQQIAGNLDLDEEGSPLTSWSAEWVRSLGERSVIVERDVLHDEAASVLRWYAEEGG